MKIGVISDTHDQGDLILKAVELMNAEKVEMAFHCGDWVSPFIPESNLREAYEIYHPELPEFIAKAIQIFAKNELS